MTVASEVIALDEGQLREFAKWANFNVSMITDDLRCLADNDVEADRAGELADMLDAGLPSLVASARALRGMITATDIAVVLPGLEKSWRERREYAQAFDDGYAHEQAAVLESLLVTLKEAA